MKNKIVQKSEDRSQRTEVKKQISFFILFSVFCLLSSVCFAQPVSSTDLIEHAKEYNGKVASFQGEAIGDIMKRGNFAWVNVNDGQNAIGIWLKSDLTKGIKYTGRYKFKGDIIEVKGKFNRACIEHGGDLDIHADNLRVIKPGFATEEKLDIQKYQAALAFLGVVLCFGILKTLRKGRRKK